MNTTEVIELDGLFFNENSLEEVSVQINEGMDLSICHETISLSEKDIAAAKDAFCKNCGEHNPNCKLFFLNRGHSLRKELSSKNPPFMSLIHVWRVLQA